MDERWGVEYEISYRFHALDSDEDIVWSSFGLRKSILAAHQRLFGFLNESRIEGQKVWGESVSPIPLGEEVEDRKYRAESQSCSSESPGILPLPARDLCTPFHQLPSENRPGTVQSARLSARWWNMAALNQQVAYFSTSEFILCGRPSSGYQKQGVKSGFNKFRLYLQSRIRSIKSIFLTAYSAEDLWGMESLPAEAG